MTPYTLVSGATSGLGLALTRELAHSKNLVLIGRCRKKLGALKEEFGGDHRFLDCDLSDTNNIACCLSNFLSIENVKVDKFIHCAGVDHTRPVKGLNFDEIDFVMRVNFYSAVELIRILIKRSINKSALSNILFVSSIAAIRGYRAKAAYSASKGALDSYMRVLSKELAPKVAVNSILPGAMPTPMTEREFNDPELVKHFKDIYPMGLGSVDQVVAVVKAYHDLENSWVTGQQVIVDGGLTS